MILSYIKGVKIPFYKKPIQKIAPKEPNWSITEKRRMQKSIDQLLGMGAIKRARECKGQFISKIFLTPKKDGQFRFILNLKSLNKFVANKHFKLEDFKTVKNLIKKDCFMATMDLKDAYFLVPVQKRFRKYLRFTFQNKLYEFNCLPFGLSIAPRIFTKIMKPVVGVLRSKGFMSNIYLDDFLLIGYTFEKCYNNIIETRNFLERLGFIINYNKSSLVPAATSTYLGFHYDSKRLTVSLPTEKYTRVLKLIHRYRSRKSCKIRDFAIFLGTIISCCPVIPYGWLHTKMFERKKFEALTKSKGNFDSQMKLCSRLSKDFIWWETHLKDETSLKPLRFEVEIFSDASSRGWGIFCNGEKSNGFWKLSERRHHINYLELLAAFFGLRCFAKHLSHCTILCRIDNITAISCINRMGSIRYPNLNAISQKIWHWCEQKNIFIFASYIKSADNTEADKESRSSNFVNEFELNQGIFETITKKFDMPDVDLFATRVNRKCDKFVSWHSDPGCFAVDAFTLDWSKFRFYAFPPFSLMLKVLQKIINDKAEGIVVAPYWVTQPWYPLFTSLLSENPLFFTPRNDLLFYFDRSPHPLSGQLTLVVGRLSGKLS